jgi:hypothetical protein
MGATRTHGEQKRNAPQRVGAAAALCASHKPVCAKLRELFSCARIILAPWNEKTRGVGRGFR